MALTNLHIEHADSLEAIENIPSLKELEIRENSKLKMISNLRRLEDLKVINCLLLDVVQGVPSLHTAFKSKEFG
jgi:hypothetical protein